LNEHDRADLISYLRTLKPPRRGAMVPIKVGIETTDGRKLDGLSLNRTFEGMQLLTPDNKIHLLRKEGARYGPVTSQAHWRRKANRVCAYRPVRTPSKRRRGEAITVRPRHASRRTCTRCGRVDGPRFRLSVQKWTAQIERIQGLSLEHGSPPATK
jgi:hypothetical protein